MQTHIETIEGRKRKLFRSKKGNWQVRFIVRGKEMLRSLQTSDLSAAIKKAKLFIGAAINGDVEKDRKEKVRSEYSTLQQVADIFTAEYADNAKKLRTARIYICALARVIAVGLGKNIDRRDPSWIKTLLENTRTNVLTAELIRDYQKAIEATIERDSHGFMKQLSELKKRTSIVNEVSNARGIFGRKALPWYEKKVVLPDLAGFLRQPLKQPNRGKPKQIDRVAMDAINAAAPELAQTNPACYIAHLLFKHLGMRNEEIRAARMTWIVWNDELKVNQLGIRFRPEEEFTPKQGTERDIAMAPDLLAEIKKHWRMSDDGNFIVPAKHKTGREDVVDRDHATWAGQWIKGMTRVSYELRRYAGSLIYKLTKDIVEVQRFLGHKDVRTTQKWYADLLEAPTHVLTMAHFAPPPSSNVVPFDNSAHAAQS